MVFDATLTGRQSGQKLQCLYGNLIANDFLQNQVLHNLLFRKNGGRLYSLILKEVAQLEELLSSFFHTFACKFGWVNVVAQEKIYRQMYGK